MGFTEEHPLMDIVGCHCGLDLQLDDRGRVCGTRHCLLGNRRSPESGRMTWDSLPQLLRIALSRVSVVFETWHRERLNVLEWR